MNSKLRVRILQAAAVATPVVAIIIFKLSSGSAPAESSAANIPSAPTSSAPVLPAPSPEQKRAQEWAGKQDPSASITSPLTPPEARGTESSQPAATPAAPRVVGVEYNLTSILKARDSAIAAINGKLYRVGDQIKPGATLVAIDTVKFTVRIQRTDGTTVDLSCDTNKPATQRRAAPRQQPAQQPSVAPSGT